MKKLIITVGLLLFAAVFMSGCVTEAEDPVVGIWHNTEALTTQEGFDFESRYMVFNPDGTGYTLSKFAGNVAYGKMDFTWKNEGNGKYTFTRPGIEFVSLAKTGEFVINGETLAIEDFEFHKEPVAEYLVGLWGVSDGRTVSASEGISSLMYFSADGTGNTAVFSQEVLGIDDIYTGTFTWEEKNGRILVTTDKGTGLEFTIVNGLLCLNGAEAYHKYTTEDNLLGLWMSDEPSKEAEGTFDIVILLRPDGTGVEIWTLPGSHVASAKYYFDWEMTSPTTYQAVYDDGEVWDFAADGLGITDGGVTYSKVGYDVLAEYAQKVTA